MWKEKPTCLPDKPNMGRERKGGGGGGGSRFLATAAGGTDFPSTELDGLRVA